MIWSVFKQLVKEASLNATELLARDFETLNAAEKELYLNVALPPLEEAAK